MQFTPLLRCFVAGPIDQTIVWREAMKSFNYRLTSAHSRLDTEISREQRRRVPDFWRLLRLKKLRLAIKDRMHRFTLARQRGRS